MKSLALEKCYSLNIKAMILKTLVLFPICPIRHNNLTGLDWPFLLIEIVEFRQRNPFRKPAKTSEDNKQDFPSFSFLAIMTLRYVFHVFCPLRGGGGNGITLNELFISEAEFFDPPRRSNVLKRTEVIAEHIGETCS